MTWMLIHAAPQPIGYIVAADLGGSSVAIQDSRTGYDDQLHELGFSRCGFSDQHEWLGEDDGGGMD